MAKLVLHVGGHKTGTTFLQNTFHDNRELLAQHGVHFPKLDRYKGHHSLSNVWMRMPESPSLVRKRENAETVWDAFLKNYSKNDGTVFLSSESFSRAEENKVDMADLGRRLSVFDDVRLVYTIRDQASLAQSVWLEISKTHAAPSVPGYIARILAKSSFGGVWFDHNLIYNHLLTGFKPDQITLLDYSRFASTKGGILGAFLDVLKCDLDPDRLSPVKQDEANLSPDALSFFVASQLTMPEVPSQTLIKAVSDIILPDPAPRTMMLRRRQYREIQKHFARLNEKLERRVQPFQPGFKIEKLPFPDGCMFRENLTEAHWIQIARLMYGQSALLRRRSFKSNPKILTRILGK